MKLPETVTVPVALVCTLIGSAFAANNYVNDTYQTVENSQRQHTEIMTAMNENQEKIIKLFVGFTRQDIEERLYALMEKENPTPKERTMIRKLENRLKQLNVSDLFYE